MINTVVSEGDWAKGKDLRRYWWWWTVDGGNTTIRMSTTVKRHWRRRRPRGGSTSQSEQKFVRRRRSWTGKYRFACAAAAVCAAWGWRAASCIRVLAVLFKFSCCAGEQNLTTQLCITRNNFSRVKHQLKAFKKLYFTLELAIDLHAKWHYNASRQLTAR